jgi:hypothetical protein
MIFIIGDHGTPLGGMGLKAEQIHENNASEFKKTDEKVVASGLPLMLIKPFHSDGDLKVSDTPVTLGDIPQTIASELQLQDKFPGVSILSLNTSDKRERKYFYYDGWTNEYWDFSKAYLPPMTEYAIDGHSWSLSSWQSMYRTYKPGEVITSSPTYEYGTEILFGSDRMARPFDKQYQVAGWSYPETRHTWTDGYSAVLAVQTKTTDSDHILTIAAVPYLAGGALDQQRVIVKVNGQHVGELVFDQPGTWKSGSLYGFQEREIGIPHDALGGGVQYIVFELPDAMSPKELGISEDKRDLALAIHSIVIDC